jgi:glycosyltransferase involved in cell wall biosynthesis
LPSYPETFGRAYIEAAASGLLPIGIKQTGIFGHFSNEEAIFLDPTIPLKNQLVEILLNMDEVTLQHKKEAAYRRSLDFRNSAIINQYYDILREINTQK